MDAVVEDTEKDHEEDVYVDFDTRVSVAVVEETVVAEHADHIEEVN